ncbi:DUF4150 domain-containing protein [Variovorax robiniae]|uniref:DUF4150 domain-containing protein n=1 Tax=Variovorax robiniae TaxID=1836199 RepID=A0ABU8XDH7_9BURK
MGTNQPWTLVHKGSDGMSIAFPDVCKTPSPAGPVPIPYPNIAQSSDAADTSTTVKADGEGIMLKGSNFSASKGDEAGSAGGVVSNVNRGKAMFVNYSFDVKIEGQNVPRKMDPMKQNGSASFNAMGPALL